MRQKVPNRTLLSLRVSGRQGFMASSPEGATATAAAIRNGTRLHSPTFVRCLPCESSSTYVGGRVVPCYSGTTGGTIDKACKDGWRLFVAPSKYQARRYD
jgi:hypothetical protein